MWTGWSASGELATDVDEVGADVKRAYVILEAECTLNTEGGEGEVPIEYDVSATRDGEVG